MSWDGLAVGARWPKCGHAKTPENTQSGHRQSPRCRICHRERARDYLERKKQEALDRGETLRGRGRPSLKAAIEAAEQLPPREPSPHERQLAKMGRAELQRLGAWGIKGNEFELARKRFFRERIR